MKISDILLFLLSVWGAAWLLVYGAGPAAMLARFRNWVGVRYDEQGNRYGENWVAELFNCPVCLSLWIAPLMLIALLVFWYIVAVFAAVGLTRIVVEFVHD